MAGAIVAVTAVLSINNEWGAVMALSLIAGIGTIAIELLPTVKLPAPRGLTPLALRATATLATSLAAIDWLGWIFEHLVSFDAIQFLTGFVAAVVLLATGYGRYQGGAALVGRRGGHGCLSPEPGDGCRRPARFEPRPGKRRSGSRRSRSVAVPVTIRRSGCSPRVKGIYHVGCTDYPDPTYP